jgi:hypothetical protein
MRTEEKPRMKSQKRTGARLIKWILLLPILLILLVLLLVPAVVSSGKSRHLILAKINESVAGHTNFANLSMGWLKGVRVEDFSYKDDSGRIAVQAQQIATVPHYASILAGRMSFGQTVIDDPKVEIDLRQPTPKAAPAPGPQPKPVPTKAAGIALVTDVIVKNGSLRITDPENRTVEATQINSKLSLRPPGEQSNFALTMAVSDGNKPSTVRADGHVTPGKSQTGWSLKGTSGEVTVEVNDLDLDSIAPFLALGGIDVQAQGVVSGNAKGEISDGQLGGLNGKITAKNVDVTGPALKGDRFQTRDLDIDAKLNRKGDTIDIENLKLKTDWATASASGTVPARFGSFTDFLEEGSGYNLEGNFKCDVAAVSSQIPATLGLKKGMKITAGQLTGDVQTSTEAGRRKVRGLATLAGLEGTMDGKKIALSDSIRAEAQISSDKTGITYDKLSLSAPFAKVDCSGKSDSVRYTAEADLTKLQSQLGQFIDVSKYEVAGQLSSKGQVAIAGDKITTSASSTVKNLRLNLPDGPSVTEPNAVLTSTVEVDTKSDVVSIRSATADASFGQFSIKDGVVPLGGNSGTPMNLAVTASQVNLEKVRPFMILLTSFPEKLQLAGLAESKVSVTSEKDVYKIRTDSTKIEDLKVVYPDRKPFDSNEVTVAFDADISPEKDINVKTFDLVSPQIKIHKGEFTHVSKDEKTKVQGRAECEYDWTAVDTVVAPYMPEGLTLQGKRKDTFSFSSEFPVGHADQLMPNLNADGTIGFDQADYMGLDFGPTNTDVQVKDGLLKVKPFTTTVNGGQVDFAADVNFKDAEPTLTAPQPVSMKNVQITEAVASKLLKYVNPLFADAAGGSGTANLSAETVVIPLAKVDKNKIRVVGTVSIDDMELRATGLLSQILTLSNARDQEAVMKLHPTHFTLKDGFVHYDNVMQIDVGNTPLQFKGAVGLDKTLDMMVAVSISSLVGRLGLPPGTIGTVVWLPLTGTIDHPKLDTSKLLENQIPDLFKGLSDILK